MTNTTSTKLKIVRFIVAWIFSPVIVPSLLAVYIIGFMTWLAIDGENFLTSFFPLPGSHYFKWMMFK